MGYHIYQGGTDFRIKKDNIKKAWDSLVKLFEAKKNSNDYPYEYIDTENVINANSFENAMRETRWDIYFDNNNNDICEICFSGESLGDDEIILNSIAPYVENGSYIEMEGEDGEMWKWKFVDGKVEEISGHWVWDDEE